MGNVNSPQNEQQGTQWTKEEIQRALKNMADRTRIDYRHMITDEQAEDMATD